MDKIQELPVITITDRFEWQKFDWQGLTALVISPDGDKFYFIDGHMHREDGPAVEYANGINHWWYQSKRVKVNSQDEFEQWLKYKTFI